jgi:general secretion pathway protein C
VRSSAVFVIAAGGVACGRDAAAPSTPAVAVVDVDPRISIREVSANERIITRRGLDLLYEHQDILMRQARIVPEVVNGKTAGIRIFGVRADGVLARFGFENGDRLESIGGHVLTDPTAALEAYAAMRNATTIPVVIVRRGQPRAMVIRVVE